MNSDNLKSQRAFSTEKVRLSFCRGFMGTIRRPLGTIVNYLALDKRLRGLLVASIIMNLGGSLWGSLLGLHITASLGIPVLVFGLMSTVQQLVSSLTIFPSGFLSDNFGRRKMIMTSTVFSMLTLATLLLVRDLPWLFLVSVFQGLSMSFMGPSLSAYVIDVITQERRGKAYATLALFQSLSGIIGTSVAGSIADIFGFTSVFGIALGLECVSLGVTIFYLEESLGGDSVGTKPLRESYFRQLKNGLAMLRNPSLLAVLFGIVFHQLGLGIQGPYLAIYASNVLVFSLPAISLMLGLQRLGIFLGHFPSGRIVDDYGGEIAFAFHIFVTSPAMVFFTIGGTPFLAGLDLFLWGLTFGLDNVSRQKLVAKYKSESGTATAFGVISLVSGVISLVTPTIGGWVWTSFSPQTVFYASAATNVLGSLPLFMLWLHNRNIKAGLADQQDRRVIR